MSKIKSFFENRGYEIEEIIENYKIESQIRKIVFKKNGYWIIKELSTEYIPYFNLENIIYGYIYNFLGMQKKFGLKVIKKSQFSILIFESLGEIQVEFL